MKIVPLQNVLQSMMFANGMLPSTPPLKDLNSSISSEKEKTSKTFDLTLDLRWLYCATIIECIFVSNDILHETFVPCNGPWFTFLFIYEGGSKSNASIVTNYLLIIR